MTKLLGTGDISRALGVPVRAINYLFEAGKLRHEDFEVLGGRRIFKGNDLQRIKNALSKNGRRNSTVKQENGGKENDGFDQAQE